MGDTNVHVAEVVTIRDTITEPGNISGIESVSESSEALSVLMLNNFSWL